MLSHANAPQQKVYSTMPPADAGALITYSKTAIQWQMAAFWEKQPCGSQFTQYRHKIDAFLQNISADYSFPCLAGQNASHGYRVSSQHGVKIYAISIMHAPEHSSRLARSTEYARTTRSTSPWTGRFLDIHGLLQIPPCTDAGGGAIG